MLYLTRGTYVHDDNGNNGYLFVGQTIASDSCHFTPTYERRERRFWILVKELPSGQTQIRLLNIHDQLLNVSLTDEFRSWGLDFINIYFEEEDQEQVFIQAVQRIGDMCQDKLKSVF